MAVRTVVPANEPGPRRERKLRSSRRRRLTSSAVYSMPTATI